MHAHMHDTSALKNPNVHGHKGSVHGWLKMRHARTHGYSAKARSDRLAGSHTSVVLLRPLYSVPVPRRQSVAEPDESCSRVLSVADGKVTWQFDSSSRSTAAMWSREAVAGIGRLSLFPSRSLNWPVAGDPFLPRMLKLYRVYWLSMRREISCFGRAR